MPRFDAHRGRIIRRGCLPDGKTRPRRAFKSLRACNLTASVRFLSRRPRGVPTKANVAAALNLDTFCERGDNVGCALNPRAPQTRFATCASLAADRYDTYSRKHAVAMFQDKCPPLPPKCNPLHRLHFVTQEPFQETPEMFDSITYACVKVVQDLSTDRSQKTAHADAREARGGSKT